MSSTINNGREKICPGELVSYRCITDGSLLAWSLPPLVNVSNAILFDSTSVAEIVRTRIDGEVLAVLTLSGTPVFDSVLTIKPTVNSSSFIINCITEKNNLFSAVYEIASKYNIFGSLAFNILDFNFDSYTTKSKRIGT